MIFATDDFVTSWDRTRKLLKSDDFLEQYFANFETRFPKENFGVGDERSFYCGKCGRLLPIVLAQLDHTVPKKHISGQWEVVTEGEGERIIVQGQECLVPRYDGISWKIPLHGFIRICQSDGYIHFLEYRLVVCGCNCGCITKPHECFHTNVITSVFAANLNRSALLVCTKGQLLSQYVGCMLENDISNLNFLCSYCNAKKGARFG